MSESPYGPPDPQTPYAAPPGPTSPYSYGPPAPAPQTPGAAMQPYGPAAVPVPYPPAPYGLARTPDFQLVSAGGRLGALLLDILLVMVTLWIGWFIWAMFTWADGQTPAKRLLGHVVADATTGEAFDWGRMALREFVVKGLLGWFLNVISISIYFWVDAFMVLGDRQRTAHDRIAGSIVRHG